MNFDVFGSDYRKSDVCLFIRSLCFKGGIQTFFVCGSNGRCSFQIGGFLIIRPVCGRVLVCCFQNLLVGKVICQKLFWETTFNRHGGKLS